MNLTFGTIFHAWFSSIRFEVVSNFVMISSYIQCCLLLHYVYSHLSFPTIWCWESWGFNSHISRIYFSIIWPPLTVKSFGLEVAQIETGTRPLYLFQGWIVVDEMYACNNRCLTVNASIITTFTCFKNLVCSNLIQLLVLNGGLLQEHHYHHRQNNINIILRLKMTSLYCWKK